MRRLMLVLVGAFAALMATAGTATATFPASNGSIVFQRNAGTATGWDLYAVRPDGSDLHPVLATAADEQDPAWNADGTELAFVRPDGVWTVAADGTGAHQVAAVTGAGSPTWSPDGTKIAFHVASSGPSPLLGAQIEVVPSSGGTPTVVGPGSLPSWSPDGTRIAFADHYTIPVSFHVRLETMAADGTDVTQVPDADWLGFVSDIDWSPNGRSIAYTTPDYRGPSAQVGVLDAASGAAAFTDVIGLDIPGVSWAPDGSKLVRPWADTSGSARGLRTTNPDGTGGTVLTTGVDEMPAWQPVAAQPPDCSGVHAVPSTLWPADRRLRLVWLRGATDSGGRRVSLAVTGVTADAKLRPGDVVMLGQAPVVLLRATRPLFGRRIYHVAFRATDAQGATCTGSVDVPVAPRRR